MRDEIFRKSQGLSIYDAFNDDYNFEMYDEFIDGEMISITFLNIKCD
ncbi:MAG: hypothetical protein Q4P34_01815 [Tissierellia bacterium]|nr:hypothetical protein [Tissierellia bacterium]